MGDPSPLKTDAKMSNILVRPDIVKIIVSSLTETIQSYTQTTVTAGKPYFIESAANDDVAVAGLIRLEGSDFSVELFLGFSKNLFMALYENMFMMPVDEISVENHDLAGEILNIAFGSMDPKFRQLNYRLNSSFPKIFSGDAVKEVLAKIGGQGLVIPYLTSDQKPFVVELFAADSMQVDWQYDPGVKHSA